jgi:hypothetical protein
MSRGYSKKPGARPGSQRILPPRGGLFPARAPLERVPGVPVVIVVAAIAPRAMIPGVDHLLGRAEDGLRAALVAWHHVGDVYRGLLDLADMRENGVRSLDCSAGNAGTRQS